MMQGASLLVALVDCGDVDAPGSIHSMVNAYVILSRVKNASGLALLRAFCPELFSGGVSPGCLSYIQIKYFNIVRKYQATLKTNTETMELLCDL